MCNAQLRRWEKAADSLEVIQIYTTTGNLMMAAYQQSGMGFCQMMAGHAWEGLENLQKAFAFAQEIENPTIVADIARMMALTEQELGHYGQAIRHARYGVEQSRTTNVPRVILLTQIAWGMVLRKLMALELAQATCLDVFAKASHEAMVGWITDVARSELCALHAVSGDWEGAYMYAKQALAASQDDLILPMGLTFWYETEALLRGGDGNLARREVERVAALVGENRRYRLPLLRSQAVLAQWDGGVDQAISHLQAALALAQEIGLPGEEWPILGELGRLYAEQEEEAQAQQAYKDAAIIIHRLAETIDEAELRVGYLTAIPVQSILQRGEGV